MKINKGPREISGHASENKRISTGIKSLDDILHGGFLSGKTFLVTGMPGTGKSIFSLQFLIAGLAKDENGLYVCVNERPEDIIASAAGLGWNIEPAVAADKIKFLDMSPFFSNFAVKSQNKYGRQKTEINIRKFLSELTKYVRENSAERLVFDSINLILPDPRESHSPMFARDFILSLEQYLDCTCLLTFDRWEDGGSSRVHPIESYVSGVIELSVSEKPGFDRTLFLKKIRATAAKPKTYKFVINSVNGISLILNAGIGRMMSAGDNGNHAKSADKQKLVNSEQNAILLKD